MRVKLRDDIMVFPVSLLPLLQSMQCQFLSGGHILPTKPTFGWVPRDLGQKMGRRKRVASGNSTS